MYYRKEDRAGLRIRLLGGTAAAALVVAFSSTLPSTGASAAGFALKEQSATAQGNSFAGATAGAEDISYMFFNPAGLTRHEGNQAAVALSYVILKAETDNAANLIGQGGEAASGDIGDDALVPAAYLLWSLSDDLKLGLGINAPFGLATEYTQTWAGRFEAVESSITTININPAVAYRLNDKISIGAGLQIQYIDVVLSSITDVADFNLGNGVTLEGLFEVTGDDFAAGFNLGLLAELSESTRIGASYRSAISQTVDGDLEAVTVFTGVSADLKTPDSASLGIYHDISDQWAVMGEVTWTGWSTFDEIRLQFDAILPDVVIPENWEDVFSYAAGATYRPNNQWTIRGGVAFDESPIPDANRTARLPGNDRTWVSIGARYQSSPNFSIDAGYTHVFVDDSSVVGLTHTADYTFSVDVIAVQGTFKF